MKSLKTIKFYFLDLKYFIHAVGTTVLFCLGLGENKSITYHLVKKILEILVETCYPLQQVEALAHYLEGVINLK